MSENLHMWKKSSTFAAAKVMHMKKYLFICLMALVGMLFTGCKEKNEPCRYAKQSVYLFVEQDEWKWDNAKAQFYVHFKVPELTADAYDYGNYSVHREYEPKDGDPYQVGLPQTICLWEPIVDETGNPTGDIYPYQQHVDYRIGIGFVEIEVTNSDYLYDPGNPEGMVFHLQIIY